MIRVAGPSFILLSFACPVTAAETDTPYSVYIKDTFVITTKKPEGYSSHKKYHPVYITDGSIGIGDYILGKLSLKTINCRPSFCDQPSIWANYYELDKIFESLKD